MTDSKTAYSEKFTNFLNETIPNTDITRKDILKITQQCYDTALNNLGIDNPGLARTQEGSNQIVGKEYIRLVRQLSTEDLTIVLRGHECDIVTREESTIQEILQELAERILIGGQDVP